MPFSNPGLGVSPYRKVNELVVNLVSILLQEDNKPSGSDKEAVVTKVTEKSEKATDYTMSWPQNRQQSKQQHFDVEKL